MFFVTGVLFVDFLGYDLPEVPRRTGCDMGELHKLFDLTRDPI